MKLLLLLLLLNTTHCSEKNYYNELALNYFIQIWGSIEKTENKKIRDHQIKRLSSSIFQYWHLSENLKNIKPDPTIDSTIRLLYNSLKKDAIFIQSINDPLDLLSTKGGLRYTSRNKFTIESKKDYLSLIKKFNESELLNHVDKIEGKIGGQENYEEELRKL